MKRKNYVKNCHYCGKEYMSNRSTSKFCTPSHRASFSQSKNKKATKELSKDELITHYNKLFAKMYEANGRKEKNKDGWSISYPSKMIREKIGYRGMLPTDDLGVLIIGNYAIRKSVSVSFMDAKYCVKPVENIAL